MTKVIITVIAEVPIQLVRRDATDEVAQRIHDLLDGEILVKQVSMKIAGRDRNLFKKTKEEILCQGS